MHIRFLKYQYLHQKYSKSTYNDANMSGNAAIIIIINSILSCSFPNISLFMPRFSALTLMLVTEHGEKFKKEKHHFVSKYKHLTASMVKEIYFKQCKFTTPPCQPTHPPSMSGMLWFFEKLVAEQDTCTTSL